MITQYYRGGNDIRTLTLLQGTIEDPLEIELADGKQYYVVKHEPTFGWGNPDICSVCVFSSALGQCSPAFRCRPGNEIAIVVNGHHKSIGRTQWHISWREKIVNPINKIDIVQVDI